MNSSDTPRGWLDQTVATAGMLGLALGVGVALWYHLTQTAGGEPLEFVFLIVMLAVLLPLTALYALRARWSYAAGAIVCIGFPAAVVKAWLDNTLYLTAELYNALVVATMIVAVAVIVSSLRLLRKDPPVGWRVVAALGGLAALATTVAMVGNANASRIAEANARLVMQRMRRELAELGTLEERLAYVANEGNLAGVTVGIVVDDELVWTGAFGEGIAEDTTFNIGSIAKPVVATAVMQLAEQGLIELEADISAYLPFSVRHPDYPDAPITTEVLLTHQACVAHHTPIYAAHMDRDAYLVWDAAKRGRSIYGEIVQAADHPDYGAVIEGYLTPGGAYYTPNAWLACAPGTQYHYSSPAYDLLGYLVEQVSGQSFDAYLQEAVFSPLGMTRTGRLSEQPPFPQATPTERVYGVVSKANLAVPVYGSARVGGGGLYSTVPDLAAFLIAHLNEGRATDGQVLQPETVTLMHRPHAYSSADLGMEAYGYGWTRYQDEPWRFWGTTYPFYGAGGHGGSDIGYRTRMLAVEKSEGGFGVIVLANTTTYLKWDNLWLFSSPLQLEKLAMEEAQRLWELKHQG